MKATAQIFLSYAREDEEKVGNLYQKLSDAGLKPWMDTKDLLPGEKWKSSIQKAIRCSDFFLACLSAHSVSKRGFLQREINDALDIWQEMLESDIYLIPVRLDDCEVPERLRDFQWVNLFEENGWTRLLEAIQVGMERRAEVLAEERSHDMEMTTSIRGKEQNYRVSKSSERECVGVDIQSEVEADEIRIGRAAAGDIVEGSASLAADKGGTGVRIGKKTKFRNIIIKEAAGGSIIKPSPKENKDG